MEPTYEMEVMSSNRWNDIFKWTREEYKVLYSYLKREYGIWFAVKTTCKVRWKVFKLKLTKKD